MIGRRECVTMARGLSALGKHRMHRAQWRGYRGSYKYISGGELSECPSYGEHFARTVIFAIAVGKWGVYVWPRSLPHAAPTRSLCLFRNDVRNLRRTATGCNSRAFDRPARDFPRSSMLLHLNSASLSHAPATCEISEPTSSTCRARGFKRDDKACTLMSMHVYTKASG